MKKLTPELSEIIGLLCAEGSHVKSYTSYWGKDRGKKRFFKNDKSERIEFYNKDPKLLKHYRNLIKTEFDYSANITKHNKINICKIKIIQKITDYTKIGHLKWEVPKIILKGNNKSKIRFLRGYFDGDGTAGRNIRFVSTNKKGLEQVSELLRDLGIRHTFNGHYLKEKRKPAFVVYIREKERERFLNILKPISKRPGFMRGLKHS